ncbi:flavin reductase family protein [Pelistega europaea]|uniref:Flavin reductase family protein n=1 Tax=Pelistega europaea TaxID=106147 RepID=A0A7Y4L9N4_9BURK|nr:flavin reductase family protein [Pelistega europaea]NOL49517.1 flavin reductase family protein [Pelistega europaea]
MSVREANFDAMAFRQALGRFATGVAIVTTIDPHTKTPLGLTISSFNSVSMTPPLVLWSLQNSSTLLDTFLKTDRYNIHVLTAEQMLLAIDFSKGNQEERFSKVSFTLNEFGIPKLDDTCCAAYFECYNKSQYPEGDHHIMVGQVERCSHTDDMPLVYHAGSFSLTPSKGK